MLTRWLNYLLPVLEISPLVQLPSGGFGIPHETALLRKAALGVQSQVC